MANHRTLISMNYPHCPVFRTCTVLVLMLATTLQLQSVTFAQDSPVGDPFTTYERVLHVEGIIPAHTVSNQPHRFSVGAVVDTLWIHPWRNLHSPSPSLMQSGHFDLNLYDPETAVRWRNLRPGGINNGAIWEGRGATTSFTTGIHLRYRFLSAAFRPILIHHQNLDFPLTRYGHRSGRSEFSTPFYHIDQPQRFGDRPFWTYDPGPSYIKMSIKGVEAGISNQNRWWGPALHYPIVMSNNAPGFRHVFLGTDGPVDIYIGDLEATILWGKLLESDYFDTLSFNDERYLTGITFSINPRPVPDLTLGFSRVFYRRLPPEGIPVRDLFRVFEGFTKSSFTDESNPGGWDVFSQMLSVYGRWVFPESGFEVYGEWARNDHSWNWRDAAGQPEHSRAYTLGFQKTFTLSNTNLLAVNAELVQLEVNKTREFRSDGSYYTHDLVIQGYTHKGQVLGVGYGPGSSSQRLKSSYYFKNGMLSAWFRRTVHNNDYLYRSNLMLQEPGNENRPKFWLHNFEIGSGSSLIYFFRQWEGEIGFEVMHEFNHDFVYQNDQTHLALNFRLRYRLSTLR